MARTKLQERDPDWEGEREKTSLTETFIPKQMMVIYTHNTQELYDQSKQKEIGGEIRSVLLRPFPTVMAYITTTECDYF